jgi:hypothetical protein
MNRLPYIWDYDIDEATFDELLAGRQTLGRLGRDWAAGGTLKKCGNELKAA